MKLIDIIRTSNANLRKSKLRTFLTASAIFMGALTLMLTTAVGFGIKSYVDEQVGSVGAKDKMIVQAAQEAGNPLGAEPKEYDESRRIDASAGFAMSFLRDSDLDKIRAEEGIVDVEPYYTLSPDYVSAGGKKYITTISQGIDGLIQQMKAGRSVRVGASGYEVTLPPSYRGALGFRTDSEAVGKKVTFGFTSLTGQKFTTEATVVGVQEKTLINGNNLTGNRSFFKETFERNYAALPDGQRQQYFAAVATFDTSISKDERQALQKRLSQQKYNAQTLEDQLGVINQVINGVIASLSIFGIITLLAATFGIVNTLLMAVKERTREIGLMKALGMGKGKIFLLFSLEAVLIGFWGSILALGAANILGRIGSTVASRTIFKDFEGLQLLSFPAIPMAGIILVIMLVSFLAAALPARRAARLNPIEALRYE
jgi:putative ABC transport system permease protein